MGSVPPLAPPPGSLATHPPVDPELVASAANTTDIPALFHQVGRSDCDIAWLRIETGEPKQKNGLSC